MDYLTTVIYGTSTVTNGGVSCYKIAYQTFVRPYLATWSSTTSPTCG